MLPLPAETVESEVRTVGVAHGVPEARPPVTAKASPLYRPELDVLRFFAFLAVYLHHVLNTETSGRLMQHRALSVLLPVTRMTFGFGLCLFFFLSSYLITSLLRIESARTGKVSLRNFYVRRMLRIWPLYVCFLLGIMVLGHWWLAASIEPSRLFALLALCGNWYSIRFGVGALVVLPLWSISVEEQFYLLWPVVAGRLRRSILGAVAGAVCVCSLLAVWVLAKTGSSSQSIWFNSLSQSTYFGGGALMGLRLGLQRNAPSLARALGGIGGGLVLWFVCGAFTGMSDMGRPPVAGLITVGYGVVAVGCALLLWGFLHLPGALLPTPLIYLGRISYGLYVFHALVVIAITTVGDAHPTVALLHFPGSRLLLSLAVTIALASLSYQGLERPFLKWKRGFERVESRPV